MDAKTLDALPKYAGGMDDCELWRTKLRNHMIAANKDSKKMLDWAESFGAKHITLADVTDSGIMVDTDLLDLANDIWGLLNINLQGNAHLAFTKVQESNGPEAWRQAVQPINSRTSTRRLDLRDKVNNPGTVHDMAHLMTHIDKWETTHQQFVRAGGRELEDEDRRAILLKMLPRDQRPHIIRQRFDDYEDMKEFLREQCELLDQLGMKAEKPINAFEGNEEQGADWGYGNEWQGGDGGEHWQQQHEDINAMNKGGKGKSGKAGNNYSPKGGGKGIRRCFNCGSADHVIAQCPVPPGKGKAKGQGGGKAGNKGASGKGVETRQCYNCGQFGHVAYNCPKKSINAVDPGQAAEDGVGEFIQFMIEEDICGACTTSQSCTHGCAHHHGGHDGDDGPTTEWIRKNMASTPTHRQITTHNRFEPLNSILPDESREALCPVASSTPFRPMLDSGSFDHVSNPLDAPGYTVRPSEGSARGQKYRIANGGKITNDGEQNVGIKTKNGKTIATVFQSCKVTRPIHSVGKMCDKELGVFFSKDKARVLDQFLLHTIENVISTHEKHICCEYSRENGVYVMDGELVPANEMNNQGFHRQER